MLLALALQVVVADGASQPWLAADRDGVFYAVFLRNGNVELSTSADGGRTFGPPVTAIDARGRARGGMRRGPRVAVDGRKRVYVSAPLSFDDEEFKKRYPTQDLYVATSDDDGKTFSPPLRVNDVPKKAPEALHALAAGEDVAYIAWLDMRDRAKGQDIYLARIGAAASKNVPAARSVCECCAPALAVDGKGAVLAWRDGAGTSSRPIFLRGARLNTRESKVDG